MEYNKKRSPRPQTNDSSPWLWLLLLITLLQMSLFAMVTVYQYDNTGLLQEADRELDNRIKTLQVHGFQINIKIGEWFYSISTLWYRNYTQKIGFLYYILLLSNIYAIKLLEEKNYFIFEGIIWILLICRLTVFVSGGSDSEQLEKECTCPEESGQFYRWFSNITGKLLCPCVFWHLWFKCYTLLLLCM